MQTVRTTISIRKDLLDHFKIMAINSGISMQKAINDALGEHLAELPDLERRKRAMTAIDKFQSLTYKKHGIIDVDALIQTNKKNLQDRAERVFGI
jgi:hypothetical protein